MNRIGIIGANGQVGFEVCMFLKYQLGIEPIAICRNSLSSVLLRRYGIECRHGIVSNPGEARPLLDGVKMVVDFSLPSGDTCSDIIKAYHSNIGNILDNLPAGGKYVFISSIMAFGQDSKHRKLKKYVFPRTVYAKTKRSAERRALALGKRKNIPVYIFRIGQVHGVFQSISKSLFEILNGGSYDRALVPFGSTFTIFTCQIAAAIEKVAEGKVEMGKYSLVSPNDICWKDMFSYYCCDDSKLIINEKYITQPKSIAISLFSSLKTNVSTLLSSRREYLRTNFISYFPEFEKKLLLKYHVSKAVSDITNLKSRTTYVPDLFTGEVPWNRINGLEGNLQTIKKANDLLIRQMNQNNII